MSADATTLSVGGVDYAVWRLGDVSHLPFTLRILLENVLRTTATRTRRGRRRLGCDRRAGREIAFRPARVLLQDFTGVPAVVDLAAMRDAMRDLGGDPARINPLLPAELVIDHSVQVDEFASAPRSAATPRSSSSGTASATRSCAGARARSTNFSVVPPDTGSSTRSTSSSSRA